MKTNIESGRPRVTPGPALASIMYQPPGHDYTEANRYGDYIRVPLPSARLVEDFGIEGDMKARRGSARQVNVISAEWLASIESLGYRIRPGEFGEQLIVTGVDVAALEPGDRLQIGSEAVLEITKPRTPCKRLEATQGRPIIFDAIGMMARVAAGGEIRIGDAVEVVSARRIEPAPGTAG